MKTSEDIGFRFAERSDVHLIARFIRELAAYERMSDQVVCDEAMLEQQIFDNHAAEVLFAVADGHEVGFALFFSSFSTFLGKAGIHLEDLFVWPDQRGKGYGKALLVELARIAEERGCGRLEWTCLDWNVPSIGFYRSLGAVSLDEWVTFRLAGDALHELARQG